LRRPQNRRKSVAGAAGEGGGGGGSGGGDARQAGGACADVGDGAGAVGGTCRAHIGCCQRAAWGARGRLRADWAWKMGVAGRRRTEIDAEEVVLTLGCRPQTQTPLPEPWLHHNHGPGGPPDCCSYGRRPATYGRGGWRPLSSGMGNGAERDLVESSNIDISRGNILGASRGPRSLRLARAGKGSNRLSAHLPTGTPACPRRKPDAQIHWGDGGERRTPTPHATARNLEPARAHGRIHIERSPGSIAPKSRGNILKGTDRECWVWKIAFSK
jgi:hypothetical protein